MKKETGFEISADQRQSWVSIAFVWIGSLICVPALMVGGMLGSGLSLGKCLLSILIGYTIICVYMCLMGMQGCDTGLPTAVMATNALGEKGAKYILSTILAIACIGIGIAAALLLIWRRAEERKFDTQTVNTLLLLILAAGFAGAKLFFVFAHWSEFRADPLGALGSEGFVVYGGIVCGLGAAYLYCRKRSLPFLRWVDCFIPGAALGQGFGRIGCFLAGCCFGKPTESFLGVTFPAGSMAPAGIPLWPVQLFSAAGDFLLAGALLLLEKKRRGDGLLAGAYLLLYSIGRFLIEFLRADPRGAVGTLSTSQFIALFTAAAGAAILILRKRGTPHG